MNRERILKLADAIEKSTRRRFSQARKCDCVAGWALRLFDPDVWAERLRCNHSLLSGGGADDLERLLDVKEETATAIYVPTGWIEQDIPASIQRRRAANMLRRLASTGKIKPSWLIRD